MLKRKIEEELEYFYKTDEKKALLITGARQIGKTYSIRSFGQKHFENYIEINLLEKTQAKDLFINSTDSKNLLIRLSALTNKALLPGKTLIFIDEVQECKELVTAIKFLVEEGQYRFILSGSLLGIELKNIRSFPVGYLQIIQMYPLDFEEFAWANSVNTSILNSLKESFDNLVEVDSIIHNQMMELFRLYLIIGGMPSVVYRFLETHDLKQVADEQNAIISLYKADIGKYDYNNKLYLNEIFDRIPSEINQKNKRFILKNQNEKRKFSRLENSFIWLRDAGVALPVFCANELSVPLLLSKATNLFKLFSSDVGLLAAMYASDIQIKILNHELDINFGSIYENFVAQELTAHGFDLYYYNNKKQGEIDFLIENGFSVLPLEIKSGKTYTRHRALFSILNNEAFSIPKAYVFHNDNISKKQNISYFPIYMLMFIKKTKMQNLIYQPDLSSLI